MVRQKDKSEYWPPATDSHSAIVDPTSKKMYIYGGLAKYCPTSNVYIYGFEKGDWSKAEIKGDLPPGRSCHAAVLYNGSMIIYGGLNVDGDPLDDMWELNLATLAWKKIEFAQISAVPAVSVVLYMLLV